MALARIITRSHQCSRELALDLLARGYAVEIVSPDKIPDNIADLELRVDTGPGDHLIASVEAHDGDRSASLEFVHHLKAPMGDFMRRPPEPGEAFHIPEEPVSFNAEPGIEDVELPADAPQLTPTIISPATQIFVDSECESFERDSEEVPRLISLPDLSPSVAVEPPSHFAEVVAMIAAPIAQSVMTEPAIVEAPVVAPAIAAPIATSVATPAKQQPTQQPQRHSRPAGWFWRAGLTFASVVLLALVLGFGLRRTGKTATQISGVTTAEKVLAAPTDVNTLSVPSAEKDSGQVSAMALPPPATKSEAISNHVRQDPPVVKAKAAKAETVTAKTSITAKAGVSRGHSNDLIARDTVTYLDERYKPESTPKSTKHVARRHPSSRKHGGVIAANTVTYLNNNPAPKTAK